jgi:hypothetical protein|nr:MAG TPA: Protein of unknown function (DUF2829) [Caudoviricetes sp.]
MNFKQALEEMKKGNKVKLPSWGGYWCWDDTKQTIMMHCRPEDADKGQGSILDIRETQRVQYTLSNVLSDEWVIADNENCTLLGGTPTFNFGEAIKYLKRGLKVCRQGWNGKGMYLAHVNSYQYKVDGEVHKGSLFLAPWIGMKTADGKFVPWLASQTDMLAEDWMFTE